MSDGSNKLTVTSNNSLDQRLGYTGNKIRVKLDGSYSWKNRKHIPCLWNKFVRSCIWWLSKTRKLFVWCS